MTNNPNSTNPTDSTAFRSRIFHAEVHLLNIEGAVLGLDILECARPHDTHDHDQIGEVRGYLINSLNEHTASLRRALFPHERLNRAYGTGVMSCARQQATPAATSLPGLA